MLQAVAAPVLPRNRSAPPVLIPADSTPDPEAPIDTSTVETSRRVAGANEGTQRERLPVLIFDATAEMSKQVARRIANLIEERQAVDQTLVLGLPEFYATEAFVTTYEMP